MENQQLDPRLEYFKAFTEAQKQFTPVQRVSKNPFFKSSYAPYEEVYKSVCGPLNANGISISHKTKYVDSVFVVETTLTHILGHSESSIHPIHVEKPGMQAMGSGETYSKRYNLVNLTAVPIIDEDDDGNTADGRNFAVQKDKKEQPTLIRQPLIASDSKLSFSEVEEIEELLAEDDEMKDRVLKGYKVASLCEIPKHNFTKIITTLSTRKASKSV